MGCAGNMFSGADTSIQKRDGIWQGDGEFLPKNYDRKEQNIVLRGGGRNVIL